MLVEFSVENFLSYRSRVTLSMRAAALGDTKLEATYVAAPGLRLLRSAVLYGANASGKSNLIKAMIFAKRFVLNSSKESQATEKIATRPFALSTLTVEKPSLFEVVFLTDQIRYRYGFSLDEERVHGEWLWRADSSPSGEQKMFIRDRDDILVSPNFPEGIGLERRTRKNALFLSVVAQLNGEIAGKVLQWFDGLRPISGLSDRGYIGFTLNRIQENKARVLELIQQADLGILDLRLDRLSETDERIPSQLAKEAKLREAQFISLRTEHQRFDGDHATAGVVTFDLGDESEGTQKFLALSGPILDTLQTGKVLVIDEFDARLHPLLSQAILKMFGSSAKPSTAQLICTTHDSNLLDRRQLRKDQIWLAEKDHYGATGLTSLAEFRIPEGADYQQDYIRGKYGAIPLIGDLWKAEE